MKKICIQCGLCSHALYFVFSVHLSNTTQVFANFPLCKKCPLLKFLNLWVFYTERHGIDEVNILLILTLTMDPFYNLWHQQIRILNVENYCWRQNNQKLKPKPDWCKILFDFPNLLLLCSLYFDNSVMGPILKLFLLNFKSFRHSFSFRNASNPEH